MFHKYRGGSSLTIGEDGLEVEVFLPPVGKVWNYEDEALEDCEIITRSTIPSEQYWERPLPPDNYEKKAKRERVMQKEDTDYLDQELQDYRAREWYRRKFGVWVMVNGKAIFLTGLYYYYLTHWKIGNIYPQFRIADVHKTYFWEYCVEDPNSYGMVEVTQRQVGKTIFGGCMLTEYTSRTSNAHAGIQSKTGPDAKAVFGKAVVMPFRKLIDFFKPVYDTGAGTAPKSELRFFATSRKGEVDDMAGKGELESFIDHRTSGEVAYDGSTLLRYMCDEVFKTTEVNIRNRHKVLIPALTDAVNRSVRGKALYTSTVEEMEGALDVYIKFWKDSFMSERKKNGRTETGLYAWFTPAQKCMFLDKYGYPDEDRALQQIQDDIDSIRDPRDRADYIRKSPRNWKEAFRSASQHCLYDAMRIDERLDVLNWRDKNYERYELVWNDDKTVVEKRKAHKGHFAFCWDFEDVESEANNNINRSDIWTPKNTTKFIIGVDPFDHNRNQDGTFSNGAAAVFRKFDALDDYNSENFVCIYVGRPPTAKMFYEEMIKLAHYFGCRVLHENNKPNLEDYFKERGYGQFLTYDAKGRAGIAGTEKSHTQIVEETETFILDRCDKVNFPELLQDWKDFELDNTTKYDLAMASGYALIGAARIKRNQKNFNRLSKKIGTESFFRKYKLKPKQRWRNSLVRT